jgi:hypothetical protein
MKNISIKNLENYSIRVDSTPLSCRGDANLFILTMEIQVLNMIREPETRVYCDLFKVSKNTPESIEKLIELAFKYGVTIEFIKNAEVTTENEGEKGNVDVSWF